MFSKSRRFTDQVDRTPAVGQYDISKAPLQSHGGAVFFPKDKRFKEQGSANDGNLLDTSNCSTISTKSTGSLNNAIFLTPRKPCGKAKTKGMVPSEKTANDELSKLSAKVNELREEIKTLKAEKEMLHKLIDGEITEDEQKTMNLNLIALNDEVGKLRKQIEEEIERNKELVYQQTNYECSLKTMQADLELANSQVAALQQQITSLEQMNVDITESREELECQCTRLRGVNTALQEEKLAFQDRLEEIETNWTNVCATKDELSADLLACKERHQLDMQTLEQSLKEKLSAVEQLTAERRQLEATVQSYERNVDHLNLTISETLREKIVAVDKLKAEKENLVVSFESLKEKHEQAQGETLHFQEEITRKEEERLENLRKCQNLEDQIGALKRSQEAEVDSLTKELKETKATLMKSELECQTAREALQEIKANYGNMSQAYEQLQHNLHMIKQEKTYVDNEVLEAQELISLLRENEQEQRTIAETLTTKLEMCNMTIANLNNVNAEYQDTIEENGRKIEDILGKLRNMTKKCETLEIHFALSQKSRDDEVERLTKELELSRTSLTNRNGEYEAMSKTLKELEKNYEDECRHRVQLEHDLEEMTHNKDSVKKELSEVQSNVAALQQSKVEQQSIVEFLRKELETLKEDSQSVQSELVQKNRNEIETLKEQLLKSQQENRSLGAAEEKAIKLKQEFGRRLIECQKNLSQKDMDLQSSKKDLKELLAELEDKNSWKRKFEELEDKIAPFQEQLDSYELEKQALLSRNTESQSEIDKLGQQYARLLGHQNTKQKIRHVQKLKDENACLKTEVAKLKDEVTKEKFNRKRLEEKLAKATETGRFDPSFAFKHNSRENKENAPL